jgi:broad specificity phosphatase PhoE
MAVLHLLRHGTHDLGGGVLAGRMPGVGLTERGRAEIAAAAEYLAAGRLAGETIAALYASPLQRTRESAEIVSERLGLPIEFRDELIELDFGEWTGTTFNAIRGDPRWHPWNQHRSLARIPGGETMRAVQYRAVEAILDIAERHRDAAAVVVSHGDVIRAVLVFALGMPLDFYGRIEVVQGSLSTIRIDESGIRVVSINERPRIGRST